MFYKETVLWENSFKNVPEAYRNIADQLSTEYDKSRENIIGILDNIRTDFPQLTVHDITHTDSLWQTGSIIAGSKIEMNPMEGFVLGCAFLMHDAVLSYEAAGGKTALRETVVWKDFYADYYDDQTKSENDKIIETDFRTIRYIHANKARELPLQLFQKNDGSSFYIIKDETLREHLAEIIGEIAASHHWDMEQIEQMDIQYPPMAGFPSEWSINPLKLACILRCADAAHIDADRAPDYLFKLLSINGVSRDHWFAQNRLSQIVIDRNNCEKAVIMSNISFKEEDYAAWNVAYDAVAVLDREIKTSNDCLKRRGIREFQIKGICGAESQEALSKYIKTSGWMPCDANVHISEVEQLVKNLGGEKLYGQYHHLEIAIRELLQNSRDAIAARRIMDEGFTGRIDIAIKKEGGVTTVTVSDNGVGMSLNTIKSSFLNFGSSFWASDLAKAEYPGLKSSEFKSVGQFGIGFYAVFMVASKVIIETRKYNEGFDNTWVIKFPNGLCLRPILNKKRGKTSLASTSIQLIIDNDKCEWNNIVSLKQGVTGAIPFDVPYSAILSNLTAGLDVDVYYTENENESVQVHRNMQEIELGSSEMLEWLKEITYAKYQKNSIELCEYIDNNISRLRKIIINGHLFGIAAINTLWGKKAANFDVITVGGLSNCGLGSVDAEYLGCLVTKPITARRDGNVMDIDLKDWANEQYQMLCEQGLSLDEKRVLPYVLAKFGIDMSSIMLIRVLTKNYKILQYSLPDLVTTMKSSKIKLIIPLSDISEMRAEGYTDYYRSLSLLKNNEWLFIAERNSDFLNIDEDPNTQDNLMECLKRVANNLKFTLKNNRESGKVVSRFGNIDAYVFSVDP